MARRPGDFIYVFKGDGTNTGQNAGITLKANQTLLSEKYDLVVGGHTLATGTPADRPQIGNSAGAGVTLASGDTVKGFDVSGIGADAFSIAGGAGRRVGDDRRRHPARRLGGRWADAERHERHVGGLGPDRDRDGGRGVRRDRSGDRELHRHQ